MSEPNHFMDVLLPSAARTATTTTDMRRSHGYRGIMLILDVTAGAAAEALTPSVQVYIPGSDTYEDITAFAATADAFTGEKVYIVYPGAVETAAVSDQELAGIPIPFQWRVQIAHEASGSWTYSLSCHYLP